MIVGLSFFLCILSTTSQFGRLTTQAELSTHIVDFLGFSRMKTAPTTIEVLLCSTLGQSDEASDLRGFLSPTTRHRCKHVLVYAAPGCPRRSPIHYGPGPAGLNFSDRADTDELTPYSVYGRATWYAGRKRRVRIL